VNVDIAASIRFNNFPIMPSISNAIPSKRLLSLDVMRGLIMLLLAAESCLVYVSLDELHLPGVWGSTVRQFFHASWQGLHFWDLVQPAFMLMAGTALYFSYAQKLKSGISWQQNFKHVAIRCLKMFVCGTALHCVYAGKLVWELWNVLTQLSITTLIAYLMIRQTMRIQFVFSLSLLLLTEILYRFVLMPGFDQPFVFGKNFGSWMDMIVMHQTNTDGWVAINMLPTAAHTIWGVMAGKLLWSDVKTGDKLKLLCWFGIAFLFVGFALDFVSITPIIKRISTSSFVFASGGWVLLMMAFLFWLVDVKAYNKLAWFFVVMGMNAIFIYLFFETVGVQWLNGAVGIFAKGFLGILHVPEKGLSIFSALVTWFAEWFLCYWLYKKKIFFKL
jgi:predicted acyltransferase